MVDFKTAAKMRLKELKKQLPANKLKNENKRIYSIWIGIKSRCLNKNATGYKHYGARGIKICDEWFVFENFISDMGESYYKHLEIHGEKDTTIERIDNEKGYCKENCKWATMQEQLKNRRSWECSKN